MKTFTTAALLAALLSMASANISTFIDPATNFTIRHFDCDVTKGKASAHFNSTIKTLLRNHRKPTSLSTLAKRATVSPPITIKTYFHILSTSAHAGSITPAMITAQALTLNTVYNRIGITFLLVNTSTTVNDAWSASSGTAMTTLKQSLRTGSYQDLNLYFHSDLAGGILGTCTLPSQVSAQTLRAQYFSDGCTINGNTMPGGSMTGYNAGMTAVHETGHWLGLLHTFEGYSCSGDGDSIADTPAQSTSTDGCPMKPAKDSCPAVPGMDAVHNYMDYSSDACYTAFSPGQVARIQTLWGVYRRGF